MVTAEMSALGTGVRILVTEPADLVRVCDAVERELRAIDESCSRFRDDSELSRLNARAGEEVAVGGLLAEALAAGLRAARMTSGAVDPTVGAAMHRIGYDRDFASVQRKGGPIALVAERVPGWEVVELDLRRRRVRIPAGVQVDLGATAKALAADRALAGAQEETRGGVLVSLGGDVAMGGPPPDDGWRVLVTDRHDAPLDGPGQVVTLSGGGLATSSTTLRRWERGRAVLHHIVDPATGLPAAGCWRTASVGAATCVDANAAATAAIVWGERAVGWLERHRLPARLVRQDGEVVRVAGWP